MRKSTLALLVSLSTISVLFCDRPSSGSKKNVVATSIFPLYDIIQNIIEERADVFFIIPIGANPHTYEPIPSVVKRLQDIDMFIGLHRDLDNWIEEYLSEQTSMKYLNDHEKEDPEEHNRRHRETNPHIWLTVKGAKKLAERITEYVSDLMPDHAPHYKKNLEEYLQRLDDLDRDIFSLFENVKNKKFIQWHPAWDYFAKDYGLEIVGTIEYGHGDKPSIKEFKALVEKARKENVKVIVIGLNLESRATEALRREIDGTLVRLDSIGDPEDKEKNSYIQLMMYNAKKLAEALNQSDLNSP